MKREDKSVMRVIAGESLTPPPIWMMRQAGRYLPEYKATRKEAGSFLDLCYNPPLATEVTLQPIRRFGFDAAILFSDILVIPDALGVDLRFEEGRGPILKPVDAAAIAKLDASKVVEYLAPVLETVDRLSNELPEQTTLLGFCGAPWTVATYMIAGHGTPDQGPARQFALTQPDDFQTLIDVLVDASSSYLIAQLKAGADAVQIFDSWASVLDEDQFTRWCVEPVKRVVANVRAQIPDAKIIGFPKGVGAFYKGYAAATGVDMIGIDWCLPMAFAQDLQKEVPIQGNLDPKRLIAGGTSLDTAVDNIIEHLNNGPLVFNLGHGITPETPIPHVQQMIDRVRMVC
ncbi:uroporphyrinogen decarboxylase [Pseudahrensia aquimaris]|uniref:Uroporphyrinogen decarboxylase n=1 Tax=Pseudahrensia aquimaris TaxID=744461 RepID=A0ABW3FE27_9HYPH